MRETLEDTPSTGQLYVVATPIGNLGDFSPRAVDVLRDVALIAAEDTRHTGRLLSHFGVATPQMALHDHNEARALTAVIARLRAGDDVAVVSDAGTPLISDPGYRVVRAAIDAGIEPIAIPGPSAVTAALSIAGLPVDQFVFIGFLPNRDDARQRCIASLADETRTVVAFESVHRIVATLRTLADELEPSRPICVLRELTKQYETAYRGSVAELAAAAQAGVIVAKGEFVLVIAGAPRGADDATVDVDRLLVTLLAHAPLKSAVTAVQELTGLPRNRLYQRALELTESS